MKLTAGIYAALACALLAGGGATAADRADRHIDASLKGAPGYQFEPVAALPAPSGLHTATLLASGLVLVAGGSSFDGVLSTAALYDPAQRRWTPTGVLNEARSSHQAVRLASGTVLVAGGSGDAGSIASAERYDATTGLWSTTGSLATPRDRHTLTVLSDGTVLAVGGNNLQGGSGNVLDSVERYDPATGLWTAAAPLLQARMDHTATLLPSGKVLVAGGYSAAANAALATAELYDPATNLWSAAVPMPQARLNPTATRLASGDVLVVGGAPEPFVGGLDSAVIYDAATNTWRNGGTLSHGRQSHTATLLPSGKVLVVAGSGMFDPTPGTAELYDPVANSWTLMQPLWVRRFHHTATALPSGEVLVAGGLMPVSATAYTDTVELFTNLGRAISNVTPAGLGMTLTAGAAATGTIDIANDGPAATTLGYSAQETPLACDAAADVPWLRANPVQGSVAGGTSAAVTVDVDTAGLAPGAYFASLCVGTDDVVTPLTRVPVQVVVNAAADTLFRGGFERAQYLRDPSFEATNFGTPAWTGSDSLGGAGATPFRANEAGIARTGYWTLSFGGRFEGALTQTASQSVALPAGGDASLVYWRRIEMLPEGTATLTVRVDGNVVQTVDVTAAKPDFEYVRQSVDIGAYADGAAHTIELRYDYAPPSGGFAFDGAITIDDVTVERAD